MVNNKITLLLNVLAASVVAVSAATIAGEVEPTGLIGRSDAAPAPLIKSVVDAEAALSALSAAVSTKNARREEEVAQRLALTLAEEIREFSKAYHKHVRPTVEAARQKKAAANPGCCSSSCCGPISLCLQGVKKKVSANMAHASKHGYLTTIGDCCLTAVPNGCQTIAFLDHSAYLDHINRKKDWDCQAKFRTEMAHLDQIDPDRSQYVSRDVVMYMLGLRDEMLDKSGFGVVKSEAPIRFFRSAFTPPEGTPGYAARDPALVLKAWMSIFDVLYGSYLGALQKNGEARNAIGVDETRVNRAVAALGSHDSAYDIDIFARAIFFDMAEERRSASADTSSCSSCCGSVKAFVWDSPQIVAGLAIVSFVYAHLGPSAAVTLWVGTKVTEGQIPAAVGAAWGSVGFCFLTIEKRFI